MSDFFNYNEVPTFIEQDNVEQFNSLSEDKQQQKLFQCKIELKQSASSAGLFLMLFGVIIYFFIFLVNLGIKIATGGSQTLESISAKYGFDLIRWFYNDLIQILSLVFTLMIINKLFDQRLHHIAIKPPKRTKINLFFIPLTIGVGYVANFISSIVLSISKRLGANFDTGDISISDTDTKSLVMIFFALCIFAPIVEEFIFRGCILNLLLPFGEKTAIICSAFFFGIFHGNLGQGVGAFAIGVFLGIAAMKTGSIYLGVVIHSINNFIAFISIFSQAADKPDDSPIFVLISLAIIGFIISAIILFVKKRKYLAISNSDTQADFIPKKYKYLITNVFILLVTAAYIAKIVLGIT